MHKIEVNHWLIAFNFNLQQTDDVNIAKDMETMQMHEGYVLTYECVFQI